jgi:uncharacterized protein with HEPN domain
LSIRRESSFLQDILSASRRIEAITAATSEEAFLADEVLPAAVLHHLTVIGEAISRLSPELKERHTEVPWHQIVAVRHRIVHAYFDLDWQILWNAAADDIPQLRKQIGAILEGEFSESEQS